jgi:hypothetical protein
MKTLPPCAGRLRLSSSPEFQSLEYPSCLTWTPQRRCQSGSAALPPLICCLVLMVIAMGHDWTAELAGGAGAGFRHLVGCARRSWRRALRVARDHAIMGRRHQCSADVVRT